MPLRNITIRHFAFSSFTVEWFYTSTPPDISPPVPLKSPDLHRLKGRTFNHIRLCIFVFALKHVKERGSVNGARENPSNVPIVLCAQVCMWGSPRQRGQRSLCLRCRSTRIIFNLWLKKAITSQLNAYYAWGMINACLQQRPLNFAVGSAAPEQRWLFSTSLKLPLRGKLMMVQQRRKWL